MQPAFGDPEFRRRLAKLLAMLSTENPAEAEAARHKLRRHLAARRLSMIDLAEHLTAAPGEPDSAALGREVDRLQAANRALEQAVRRSRAEATQALQRATLAERELGRRRSRMPGRNTAAGAVAAVALLVLAAGAGAVGWTWLHGPAALPKLAAAPSSSQRPAAAARPASPAAAPAAPDRPLFSWQPEAGPSPGPGERAAFVRRDGTVLRDRAAPEAAGRAVLARGLPVVVLRTERRAGQDWSLVQTPQGQGYVTAASLGAAQ